MAIRLLSSENIDGNATFTGSVGIGAAPANKLHIQQAKSGSSAENYDLLRFNLTGTGAIGDSSSIVWYSTSGTKTAGIQGISGQDNILYGEIAFNVRKYTTDSFDEVMRINNRGSVGIGGAPASDSVLTVRGADTNNKYIRTINNNGTAYFGTIADGTGVIESNTSLKFTTGSSFTERMRIDSSGNVGIGTSSPSTVLDVRNSINIGGAGQDSNIYFQQNTSNQARINYYTDNSMIFDNWNGGYYFRTTSSFTPRVTILNGGNVGIGTTSPSEILQTNKNSAGNIVGGYFTNSQANTGAESVSLAFGLNRSGGDFVRQVKAITFGAEQQWTGTPSTVDGYLAFSTVSNETVSERMRITSGGNVNISTSGAQLFFADNGEIRCLDVFHRIRFRRSENILEFVEYGDIIFTTGSTATETMRVTSGGNVAIGETGARNARLLLNNAGSSGAPQLMLIDSGDSGKQSEIRFDSGTLYFEYWSGSSRSERMRIDSSGNVGIGTSSPSEKLDVSGSIAAFGDDKSIVVKSANGTINATMGAASSSAVTRGTITVRDSGITKIVLNANDNSYFNGGNVGIGTTSPGNKLEVAGNAKFAGDGNYTLLLNRQNGKPTIKGVVDTASHLIIDSANVNDAVFLQNYNGGNVYMVTGGGRVGIGTTSPSYKLQVNGTAYINETLYVNGATTIDDNLYVTNGNVGIGATASASERLLVLSTLSYGVKISHNKPNSTADFEDALFLQNSDNNNANVCRIGMSTYGADGQHHRVSLIAERDTSASYRGEFSIAMRQSDATHPKRLKLDYAGTLTVSGDVVAYGSPSDKRYKENIKPVTNALDKVSKLQGVTFDWKESESLLDIKEDIGFIAQDVQEVLPELVRENEDGKLSLRDKGIVPILVEAIKELKAEIEELKKSN